MEYTLLKNYENEKSNEFENKEKILRNNGKWLSPWEFYELVYSDFSRDSEIMVVEAGRRYVAMKYAAAIEYGFGKSDIYFTPAVFWQNYKRDSKIDKLYAFVIDIDNVTSRFLSSMLASLERNSPLVPTAINNSGSGVHFYYILEKPLLTYPKVRRMAGELYKRLNKIFEFETDKHSIGHAFRAVGSMTKYGNVTTAYKIGDLWTPEELAEAVGMEWVLPEPSADAKTPASEKMVSFATYLAEDAKLDKPDFSNFGETYKFIGEQSGKRFRVSRFALSQSELAREDMFTNKEPNARKGWYYGTRRKILERAERTRRYSSLMALCVIAYKCRIPKGELVSDVEEIADLWSADERWRDDPFNRRNLPAALRCYSQKFLKVSRAKLEEWLGWEFGRTKRNGRTRKEHLTMVANLKKSRSFSAVADFIKAHPEAKKTEIAAGTGLSRVTVNKYYDAAKQII